MRNERGFSLIELLIVVAIIGIIAAIAIPNFTSSRIAANEASAISSVRTICTAQLTYAATEGNGHFGASLAALNATNPPLIDSALAAGAKSGYNFAMVVAQNPDTFQVTAVPQGPTVGKRGFYSDQTGVITVDPAGGAPTAASAVLGN